MTENCDDCDGYKKKITAFAYKCGEIVWASEEQMKKNLKCYDDAHSKANGITPENEEAVAGQLEKWAEEGQKPICKDIEENVLLCVRDENNIASCFREIEYFKECLGESVREMYEEGCESHKI